MLPRYQASQIAFSIGNLILLASSLRWVVPVDFNDITSVNVAVFVIISKPGIISYGGEDGGEVGYRQCNNCDSEYQPFHDSAFILAYVR